jgi:hypothetical protein
MFVLVLTDMCCWVPIILLKVLALAGSVIAPAAYAWISIFILPINSSLNPALYSLMTPSFIRQVKEKCGCIPHADAGEINIDSSRARFDKTLAPHTVETSLKSTSDTVGSDKF